MNRDNFPLIALVVALPLLGVLFVGGMGATADDGGGTTRLPLLTLLTISEFGLVMTLIAVALGVQQWARGKQRAALLAVIIGCGIAALLFLSQLLRWWPL